MIANGERLYGAADFPALVVSDGHSPIFDRLAEALGAERATIEGKGHSVPETGATPTTSSWTNSWLPTNVVTPAEHRFQHWCAYGHPKSGNEEQIRCRSW